MYQSTAFRKQRKLSYAFGICILVKFQTLDILELLQHDFSRSNTIIVKSGKVDCANVAFVDSSLLKKGNDESFCF